MKDYEYLIKQILESEYSTKGYTEYYNQQEEEPQELNFN